MQQASTEQLQSKYLTVSALNTYIKRKFDADPYLTTVYVMGEISNFKERPRDNQYFSVKDQETRIKAVMYRRQYEALSFRLEEGMQVFIKARVTTYMRSGDYQLIVEDVKVDGIGLLHRQLKERLERYHAQGLFDKNKRPLPHYPTAIAVITSPDSSVIHDIISTTQRRYPFVEITIFPTLVQGKEAKYQIAEAFKQVEAVKDKYDLIILARGGGSIEDLWAFNEDEVAEAILASSLPVISSIGHETDTTLADYLADHRAETPTAAAEMAVPKLENEIRNLYQIHERLLNSMQQKIKEAQKRYDHISQSYIMRQPEDLYRAYMQSLDYLKDQLENRMSRMLESKVHQQERLESALFYYNPQRDLKPLKDSVLNLEEQLTSAISYTLKQKEHAFVRRIELLNAYNPLETLKKGYAFVEYEGKVLKNARDVKVGDELVIRLSEGELKAEVKEVTESENQGG